MRDQELRQAVTVERNGHTCIRRIETLEWSQTQSRLSQLVSQWKG